MNIDAKLVVTLQGSSSALDVYQMPPVTHGDGQDWWYVIRSGGVSVGALRLHRSQGHCRFNAAAVVLKGDERLVSPMEMEVATRAITILHGGPIE